MSLSVKRHRRSIRLKGYDYSQAGAYFVTICTQDRACIFGEFVDREIRLTPAGQLVETVWNELPQFYPGIDIDAFVVMPNHFHGIVIIGADSPNIGTVPRSNDETANVGAAPRGRPNSDGGTNADGCDENGQPRGDENIGQPRGVARTGIGGQPEGVASTLSLPDVVHRFKTMTTKRYTDGVKQSGWEPYNGRVWQRNYYEHIIRNETSLNAIRDYIANNPLAWELDHENTASQTQFTETPWLA